ncbi:hypothetical protein IC611_14280 [Proteus mirabilis]
MDPELSIPNIVYLDAEARKWVNPTATRKSLYPDDLNQAWLATYTVTNDWNGQIETSLFNLKATLPNEYPNMIKSLNYFFQIKGLIVKFFQVHVNRLFYQMEGNIRLMS